MRILQSFFLQPRRVFLFDAVGAVLSAVCLAVILPRFDDFFGAPTPMLYFLAAFPVVFLLFDLWCLRQPPGTEAPKIRLIAWLNLGYCLISLLAISWHAEQLTIWAWSYFVAEIILVFIIGAGERWLANNLIAEK